MTQEFARTLAQRVTDHIQRAVPSEFILSSQHGEITIRSSVPGDLWTTTRFQDLLGQEDVEGIIIAARAALESAQDFIIETLHGESWPPDLNGRLPLPHASVENGMLRMWFGTSQVAALTLDSIELDALRR